MVAQLNPPAVWRIATKTRLGESIPRGCGLGKGQVQQEGAQVQQGGVQVQKKGSHLQKNCSKVHEKCPGPKEMERGPKKTFSDFNVFMVWKDMILEPSHI